MDLNRCWKPNSLFKLILKVPETFIVAVNLFLAILIVKTINSRLSFSKEKIIRFKFVIMIFSKRFVASTNCFIDYNLRRLARSILILLPIYEFHFIIFTWIPFMKIDKMSLGVAKFLNYVEAFFYGFMVIN